MKIDGDVLGVGDQAVSSLVNKIQTSSEESISIEIERENSYQKLTPFYEKKHNFKVHYYGHPLLNIIDKTISSINL